MSVTPVEAPYRVVSVEPRTTTILELWLRPLAGTLSFLPGEYVLLENRGAGIPPRSYSIANAPRPDGLISLFITRVPGGRTSTWIHERLNPGDDVCVDGPYGTFVDDPVTTAPSLFLAAGSGLAPMRALVEAALAAGRRRSVTLMFSARTEADVIDGERFVSWEQRHPRFRFVRTLTGTAGRPPTGRLPALLIHLGHDLGDHDVFIAGAPRFVAACAAAAYTLGAAPRRVHTEEFFVDPQRSFGTPMKTPAFESESSSRLK